ncbi:glycoside hydrolase family 2, partial [candidate division KSB1 bacterium]
VFVGENLRKVDRKPFEKSWWYRTTFSLPRLNAFPQTVLRFNGINYRANIWLNGQKIASGDTVFGAFRVFEFDVSSLVKEKNNRLLVQIFPPEPGDFTIGFVDWNPAPPDKNMGLWRPVEILRAKSVLLEHPFVETTFDSAFTQARLSLQVRVRNLSARPVDGTLVARIEKRTVQKTVHLAAGQSKLVTLDGREFSQLIFTEPRLWWPHRFGQAELYRLDLQFKIGDTVCNRLQTRFGMRKVESYFTKEGHRGFKINGRKILIQGAGWTDDLFLADTPQKVRAQLQYVKEAGLNTIRLEGFWGNDQTLYDTCDSLGILIMAGFSCHWEWESYLGKACDRFGGARTEEDFALLSAYWHDQILRVRNHPSVFVWLGGSDMLPRPELEKRYLRILDRIDGTRPYLGAAAAAVSTVSGPTGVKMNGPYDYVPPKYWYEDRQHGGAFGFNTETGPGPQPSPLSTLKKMIPQEHLWPIDSVWNFHCGRNEFNTLNRYLTAMKQRYGAPKDVRDFERKAQAMNYEAMRPMFEAFAVNKFKATGVILWMLNSAWPELYWQLYDYYLMPNGAYYGAKKACAPLQLIYDYHDQGVYLHNSTLQARQSLQARIRLFDFDSKLKDEREITVDIAPNAVKRLLQIDRQFVSGPVYFLDLRLSDARGDVVATNFYWLPVRDDLLDYAHSTWFVTPQKHFADLTALNRLPQATVRVKTMDSTARGKQWVRLENTSGHIAFMLYLELQNERGEPILPAYWDDNYVSLMPHESRLIHVTFPARRGKTQVKVSGWNVTINR